MGARRCLYFEPLKGASYLYNVKNVNTWLVDMMFHVERVGRSKFTLLNSCDLAIPIHRQPSLSAYYRLCK
jgi:hypothetical protein